MEEGSRALQEWRAGSIEPFVADDVYFTVLDGGDIFPSGDLIGFCGAGLCAGSGPGENDEFRICGGDLFVGDGSPCGHDHFASAEAD